MNEPQPLCFVVDDDPVVTGIIEKLLTDAGWRVRVSNSSIQVLDEIVSAKPDCVLLDIMMPELDGLELCKQIREYEEMSETPVVMLSSKSYEFDRTHSYKFGANGYIVKPVDPKTFANELKNIVDDRITINFWGVRGTLPVPGKHSLRYGGNTSCVSMSFQKERLFIFDAGTGIKVLSDHLLKTAKGRIAAKILISHSHWDHINAIPFFVPLYIQGNEFEICGPSQGSVSVMDMVSAQMDDVYFPITMKEFGARVYFQDLHEGSYEIDGIEVKTMLLSHPGYCLGYRINYNSRSICYITDNEMFLEDSEFYDETYIKKLEDFIRGANVLITDSTYFDEEYPAKVGWGHSCLSQVAKLAHDAQVKILCLFHHDPDQSDADIDRKLEFVKKALQDMDSKTVCLAPAEKQMFKI